MVTADADQSLLVQMLGSARAWRGERELKVGGPQRQAITGMLAMRANQPVSRDELIDGVWVMIRRRAQWTRCMVT
jgi:DNA-binding SARP family transcriptional activator